MRKPRIHIRDFRSCIEINNVSSTKDIMRQVANGEPLNLNVTGTSGSYDFDGQDPDLDAQLVEDAPNKIDQHLYRDKYISQAFSKESDPSPAPEPPAPPAPLVPPTPPAE